MKTIEITLPLGNANELKAAQDKIKELQKIGFKVDRNIGGMAVILTK